MGKVIIRATLAVFVCCLLYEFFDIGTGIPFYAGIAAVICLQSEIKSTVRVGLNRTVGTLFGGFTGMGILYLTHNYYILSRPILRYALITLCIIPLMYIANVIRKVRIPIGWDETSLFPGTKVLIDFLKKSTLTNITCTIAWPFYARNGLDDTMVRLRDAALALLHDDLREIVIRWEERYGGYKATTNNMAD